MSKDTSHRSAMRKLVLGYTKVLEEQEGPINCTKQIKLRHFCKLELIMYKWKRLIYDLGLDCKVFFTTCYIYVHCTDVRKCPSPFVTMHHAYCFVISRHRPKFLQQNKIPFFIIMSNLK